MDIGEHGGDGEAGGVERADTLTPETLRSAVATVMETHWQPHGYTAPNAEVYPWQWLWDSCFHALIWHELGEPERALTEVRAALADPHPTGFVPHMRYTDRPEASVDFWGRHGASSITQPPMYGHALAQLSRAGVDVDDRLVASARDGLEFLLSRRHRLDGLPVLCHPWESGADDSPRWDAWCPGGRFDLAEWHRVKGELVRSIVHEVGAPIANPDFRVASTGFAALVAFNARELRDRFGVSFAGDVGAIVDGLVARWDDERATWTDVTDTTTAGSASVRTADALLPLLVIPPTAPEATAAWSTLMDADAFAAPYGPRGVDRREPVYEPDRYWRGPCWPQLGYLLWVAARRHGRVAETRALAEATRRGVVSSGLAEYWNADTGAGRGAIPQSWAGVALLFDPVREC